MQCAARQRQARRTASLRRRKLQDARNAAAKKAKAAEKNKKRAAAATKIQSVARGFLARKEVAEAAERAALDAAIAARRAKMKAEAGSGAAGGRVRGGGAEWRKKSVVGKRGSAGLAGLTLLVGGEEGVGG